MKLELHQQAIENYNERAETLLTKLRPDPHGKPQGLQGEPLIYTHKFSGDAVQDFSIKGYVDVYGQEIARVFKQGQEYIGLFDEDYKSLIKLA